MVMSTKDTKPRGYAFIEYEHEKDMHCKYPDLIRAVLYMVLIPNFKSDCVIKQSCPFLISFLKLWVESFNLCCLRRSLGTCQRRSMGIENKQFSNLSN